MKLFKINIRKTHKGSGFGDVLATGVCLVVIMALIIAGVHFFKLMEIKKSINTEARAGLLMLEQKGELTEKDVETIVKSISKIGFKSENIKVTFNGENKKVEYGEEVSITIEAVTTYKEIGMSEIFGIFKNEYKYRTTLRSISKA